MNLNTRPVPEHIAKRITEQGGMTPSGQPLFRIIWGSDRLTLMGGEWKKFDDSGNVISSCVEEKLVTKYANAENCWILEMWTPPENYGTMEQWEAAHTKTIDGKTVRELGPYPFNGEYELVKALQAPKTHQFVPLTATICDAIISVVVRNRHLPHAIRMAAYRDQQQKIEEAKVQKRIDMIENMALAWDGKAHIIVPQNITQKGRVTLT